MGNFYVDRGTQYKPLTASTCIVHERHIHGIQEDGGTEIRLGPAMKANEVSNNFHRDTKGNQWLFISNDHVAISAALPRVL